MSAPKAKLGPEPTILSRREVDSLYETFSAITAALARLDVDYIVTGGSLLGATRQHSILFCDDDIDIAIIDRDGDGAAYARVRDNLQELLGGEYKYTVRPWEGGDKVRSNRVNSVFVDIFTLRRFDSLDELRELIGVKANGQPQSTQYVEGIVDTITKSAFSQGEKAGLDPFWHFNTRKAVELWPKEVYRESELFPLNEEYKFGPCVGVKGPKMPVLLLRRAFGVDCFEVYYQSLSHKSAAPNCKATPGSGGSGEHNDASGASSDDSTDRNSMEGGSTSPPPLAPLVDGGGTWESATKVPLTDEQYIPMQPMSKAKRRYTLHGRENLFRYLQEQSKREEEWMWREGEKVESVIDSRGNTHSDNDVVSGSNGNIGMEALHTPRSLRKRGRTVYMDGVFDLFHIGHLEAIRQCASLGDRVIIGVTGQADAAGYKRPPIIAESERVAIVAALREVDEVVCPCPLIVTEEFMAEKSIDLVVHGFANDKDAKRQEVFFEYPMKVGKFKRIAYYDGLSTTDIINTIKALPDDTQQDGESITNGNSHTDCAKCTCQKNCRKNGKPQWFGATVAAATEAATDIPTDPFPLYLRIAVEPHIRKASKRREEALGAIREATGDCIYDEIIAQFKRGLGIEGEFEFDTEVHPLLAKLLECMGLPSATDLTRLHEHSGRKDSLYHALTKDYSPFQVSYDEFVRNICAPHMASIFDCDEIYYQAFPCIRIVRPDEFSIGPHADCAYGHHPCSVNFYVPLTDIGGTSSLFLESRPGSEDWHPIEGSYGMMKRFAGAMCTHWTTDNKTGRTRASLDFRLIAGPMFRALECGGSLPGGQLDVYRKKEGYYSCCRKVKLDNGEVAWERDGHLLSPDARTGFPWTVNNWDKILAKSSMVLPPCPIRYAS